MTYESLYHGSADILASLTTEPTMNIAPADLIRNIESGRAWPSLPMSEQIVLRAMVRRIVAMANDGTTAEDWQQLAGYAEWASKPMKPLPPLAVHGQWIDWRLDMLRPADDVCVEVRLESGRTLEGRAGSFVWGCDPGSVAIVAYRIID